MAPWMSVGQRWNPRILRRLFSVVALAYLPLEKHELAEQGQLTRITVFGVLVLVASVPMSLAHVLATGTDPSESQPMVKGSVAKFTASLFSGLDSALNHLLVTFQKGSRRWSSPGVTRSP